ncbi:hypothetical protein ACFOY5_23405 [Massilia aurea]|uniref:hypothetical protein n=1 Tax=Massilia aurea TaxID=373040 RepID=UPI0021618DA5|nr:hypothetical protein [Massilia aurea]MCS0706488.1 hypothetical protein [Massilia aurea]
MPKLKPEAPVDDPIERDFLDAIQRLLDGNPKHKTLKLQKERGALKINISNVAMEAGRARTLIALEQGCRYPRVRELVKQAKSGKSALPTTLTELTDRLRFDKAELTAQVKKYQVEAAVHFQARVKAEAEAKRERNTVAQLRRELAKCRDVIQLVPKAH